MSPDRKAGAGGVAAFGLMSAIYTLLALDAMGQGGGASTLLDGLFFLLVPLAALTLFLAWLILPPSADADRIVARLGLAGAVLLLLLTAFADVIV